MKPKAKTAQPGGTWSDPGGMAGSPFSGPGVLARSLPFAVVAVLAEGSLVLVPGSLSVPEVVLSLVLLLAAMAAFLLPWARLPGWVPVLVPLAYTGSVLELSLAAGPNSGVGIVILIPLVWAALFQRRWESATIVAAIVAAEVVVSVAQAAPASVIIRRVVLWALLGALISVATHGLRDRIHRAQVESAELQDRLRRLTVLTDRERIATDLQDQVAQRILAAGTALQGTAQLTRDEEVRRRVKATQADLDEAARLLRQVIFGLGHRPPGRRLRREILTICAGLPALPKVVFTGPVDEAVTSRTADQLLQALRDGFATVGKRAAISEVRVTADGAVSDPMSVTVSVAVTGSGPGLVSSPDGNGAARGLAALRERASQAGAGMDIEPVPDGVRLSWQFR